MPDWAVTTRIGAANGLSGPFATMARSVLGFGNSAGSAFDHATRRASLFKTVFGAAFFANLASRAVRAIGSEIRQLVTEGLELASNLVEVQNVVDTTFGAQAAGTINKWSRQAMTAYGLSELQAKQFTGTMGAMLKSSGLAGAEIVRMSEGLVGLAGDFASFYNLDAETAFEKIRSGISGETEPLKQLGINMSVANMQAFALTQGIRKQWTQMGQAQQQQLRYAYLMKASADAQGDFAKTLETSYANQRRVLTTNLQQVAASALTAVLPLALKFTKRLNEIVAKAGDWIAANRELIQQKVEAFVQKIVGAVTRFGRWFTDHKAEIAAFWDKIVGALSWLKDHAKTILIVVAALKTLSIGWHVVTTAINIAKAAQIAFNLAAAASGGAAAIAGAAPAVAAAATGLGPAATALMAGLGGGGAAAVAGGASMAALTAIPLVGAALTVGRSALPMVTQGQKFQQAARSGEKFEGGGIFTNLFARAAGLGYRLAGVPREPAPVQPPNAVAAAAQRQTQESMRLFTENKLRFTVDNTAAPGVRTRIRQAPASTLWPGAQYAGAR